MHTLIYIQDGSHTAPRRSTGRGAARNGNATRPPNTQRGLAQTRRPARIIATPDDEDDDPSEAEEEENTAVADGEHSAKTKKNGLAAEVFSLIVQF